MFFIFGYKKKKYPVSNYVTKCKYCHRETPHAGVISKSAITFFVIPIIPIGYSKKLICRSCGHLRTLSNTTDLTKQPHTPAQINEFIMMEMDPNFAKSNFTPPPQYPCPDCGNVLTLDPNSGRWFCRRCNKHF